MQWDARAIMKVELQKTKWKKLPYILGKYPGEMFFKRRRTKPKTSAPIASNNTGIRSQGILD
jgi:hypothetical protein